MSLTPGKMTGSLKEQLLQQEKDLKAELEAIEKAKARAGKVDKKSKKKD
jgi:hypothetical protein